MGNVYAAAAELGLAVGAVSPVPTEQVRGGEDTLGTHQMQLLSTPAGQDLSMVLEVPPVSSSRAEACRARAGGQGLLPQL